MTLEEFCRESGSEEKAAHRLGVTVATVSRWLNGHNIPTGLSAAKLADFGITEIEKCK